MEVARWSTKEAPNPRDLARAVINLGYDLQQDHYESVAAAAGIELTGFMFVFVQSTEPYRVTVVELDEAFCERGSVLRALALERYLHPEFTDSYPGERERLTLAMPGWAALD